MDIIPLGLSSFKIRGKHVSVVTDPYTSEVVGIKFPKHTESNIVTVSHQHKDHNAIGNIEGNPFVVKGPGEYEIQGVTIMGFTTFHDSAGGKERGTNTIYRIEIDGVTIAHLGDLGHTLSSDQVEELDGVDILCIPVGGHYTIDAATAASIVGEIEPKIVIPMHYQRKEFNQQTFGVLAPVADFFKEMGKEKVVPLAKLSISKDKLPQELQVVVLE